MISNYTESNHKTWDKHLAQLGGADRTAKQVIQNTSYFVNYGCEIKIYGND